eukprot:s243_g20.t3
MDIYAKSCSRTEEASKPVETDTVEGLKTKRETGKARFRLDTSLLDESLHVPLGMVERIIRDGRKDKESKRQRALTHAAKEKDYRPARWLLGLISERGTKSSASRLSPNAATRSRRKAALSNPRPVSKPGADDADSIVAEQVVEVEEAPKPGSSPSMAMPSPGQMLVSTAPSPTSQPSGRRLEHPGFDPERALRTILAAVSRPKEKHHHPGVHRVGRKEAASNDLVKSMRQLEQELPRLPPSFAARITPVASLGIPGLQLSAAALERLGKQARSLDERTLASALLGCSRLRRAAQRAAGAPTAKDAQKVASAAVRDFAAVLSRRRGQSLRPLEAASLAVSCSKARVRDARLVGSFASTLTAHLQAGPDVALSHSDVLACLAAFVSTSLQDVGFMVAACDYLKQPSPTPREAQAPLALCRALQGAHAPDFGEVLLEWWHGSGSRSWSFVVELLAAAGPTGMLAGEVRRLLVDELRSGSPPQPLSWRGGTAGSAIRALATTGSNDEADSEAMNVLAQAAAQSVASWQLQDIVNCAEAICALRSSNAVDHLWHMLLTAVLGRPTVPSAEALRLIAAMAETCTSFAGGSPTDLFSSVSRALGAAASRTGLSDAPAALLALEFFEAVDKMGGRRISSSDLLRSVNEALDYSTLPTQSLLRALRWLCQGHQAASLPENVHHRLLPPLLLRLLERAPTPVVLEALSVAALSSNPAAAAAAAAAFNAEAMLPCLTAMEELIPELLLCAQRNSRLAITFGALGVHSPAICAWLRETSLVPEALPAADCALALLRCAGPPLAPEGECAEALTPADAVRLAVAAAIRGDRLLAESYILQAGPSQVVATSAVESHLLRLLQDWLGIEGTGEPLLQGCAKEAEPLLRALERLRLSGQTDERGEVLLTALSIRLSLTPWLRTARGDISGAGKLLAEVDPDTEVVALCPLAEDLPQRLADALLRAKPSEFAHLAKAKATASPPDSAITTRPAPTRSRKNLAKKEMQLSLALPRVCNLLGSRKEGRREERGLQVPLPCRHPTRSMATMAFDLVASVLDILVAG